MAERELLLEILKELKEFKADTVMRLTALEKHAKTLATQADLQSAFEEQQKDVITLLQLINTKVTDLQESQEVVQGIMGKHEVRLGVLGKQLIARR